jgi:hypothetical protein
LGAIRTGYCFRRLLLIELKLDCLVGIVGFILLVVG